MHGRTDPAGHGLAGEPPETLPNKDGTVDRLWTITTGKAAGDRDGPDPAEKAGRNFLTGLLRALAAWPT